MTDDIILSGICKRYGTKQIFDDFDLKVEQGEFLCITGKSGCGKTTLLNIIGLMEQPEDGTVCICGMKNPAGKERLKLLRNHLAYCLQNNGFVDDETVDYNLAIAQHFKRMSSYEKRTEREEILARLGLVNVLNKKVYTLSGGEQQRAALAQCLIKPSQIILLDEPTSSLDVDTKEVVTEQLQKLRDSGKTVVLVTHDAKLLALSSRTIRLD